MTQPTTALLIDLTPITDRLTAIEQHIAGARKPEIISAAAALKLFGGTKSAFYRLVAAGEIEQIKYDEHGQACYDAANICAVIDKHRKRSP